MGDYPDWSINILLTWVALGLTVNCFLVIWSVFHRPENIKTVYTERLLDRLCYIIDPDHDYHYYMVKVTGLYLREGSVYAFCHPVGFTGQNIEIDPDKLSIVPQQG